MRTTLTLFIAVLCAAVMAPVSAQNQAMSFFVSSAGSGMGGNLGGLAGADKLLPGARREGRRRESKMAGVSEHQHA